MATEQKRVDLDLETMRHSFAHVLAMAVQRLYPGVRLGIGPATKNGFYYEFDLQEKISDEDLIRIEDEMRKIIAEEIPFKQIIVSREQAFNTLIQLGQIYKTELLQNITDEQISFFRTGEEFIDLCRGPHVAHTGLLGVFKLIRSNTVHWMGDEKRPLLQRIEGVGFATPEQMFEYEKRLKEINQRDHKKQAKNLDLAIINTVGNETRTYWLQKGLLLKNILLSEVKSSLIADGFVETKTPRLNFIVSADNITSSDVRTAFLENSLTIFDYKRRSYKEMPVKLFEAGLSKATDKYHNHGLFNSLEKDAVESFVFCENHEIAIQITKAIANNIKIFNLLGVDNLITELCVPDLSNVKLDDKEKKHLNDSYQILKNSLAENEITYKISTKEQFVYYAPYITFSIRDIHDREWEISKVTHVYNPKLKSIHYINARNNKEKVEIIYNQIIYSIDRLIAFLLESVDGSFPTWMSPVQVDLLSISEKYNEYVTQLNAELQKEQIRSSLNLSNEPIQTKIRKSQLTKVPYMLIIGEKEIKTNSVSLRNRNGQELGLIRIDEFIDKLKSEINIEKKVAV